VFGVDFDVLLGFGVGDVTARLRGVDLAIPTFGINSTDIGCEAGDFAGFPAGTVALLQRGTCDFADKVFNAFAAGAVGVINEGGDPSRIDRFLGTLGPAVSPVPVLTTTFPVGLDLFMMLQSGGANVHRRVTEVPDPVSTPEPASMLLLPTALAAAGVRRWRRVTKLYSASTPGPRRPPMVG
jgi:hypothetical protein